MRIKPEAKPVPRLKRKVDSRIALPCYSVGEYRSQDGSIIVISRDLKESVEPRAEHLPDGGVALLKFIMRMIPRDDHEIELFSTLFDMFNNITQQLKSGDTSQPSVRISEDMKIGQLQNTSRKHAGLF